MGNISKLLKCLKIVITLYTDTPEALEEALESLRYMRSFYKDNQVYRQKQEGMR